MYAIRSYYEIRRKTEEERTENEFPIFEEGENAVRISTIHLSKGLEFPVVILANLSRGGRKPPEGLRVDRVRELSAVIFPGFRTYSSFRRVPRCGRSVTFEEWEAEKQDAEERRLLYVAATRAQDRRITSYNVCYTKLLRPFSARGGTITMGRTMEERNPAISGLFAGPFPALEERLLSRLPEAFGRSPGREDVLIVV